MKIQQNACTYADVEYLFQNCLFLKSLRQNIEFLSKIVVIFSLSISYFFYSSVIGALMTNNVQTQLRLFLSEHENTLPETSNTSAHLFNRFNFDSDVNTNELEQQSLNESFQNLSMKLQPVISPSQLDSGAKNMNRIEFNGLTYEIGKYVHLLDVTKQNEWGLKANSFAITLKSNKR